MTQDSRNIADTTPLHEKVEQRRNAARELQAQFRALIHDNLRLVIIALCAGVFIWLVTEVEEGELNKLDRAAYWLIVEHLRFDWLTPVMEAFSGLATPMTLLVLLLCIAAFAPGRRPGWCCACNLGLVIILNQALKFIIQRPRPTGFRLVDVSGYSFPSGHSMVSMAFFGLLVWFVWKYEKDKRLRFWLMLAYICIIAMVGISRIYLGVHYATDVLAGFCLSIVWLALYTRLVAPLFLNESSLEDQEAELASKE